MPRTLAPLLGMLGRFAVPWEYQNQRLAQILYVIEKKQFIINLCVRVYDRARDGFRAGTLSSVSMVICLYPPSTRTTI